MSPCSCLPLIKCVTDLKITPAFIFEVAVFITAHQVSGDSDGQHQYSLLNHQFLIVSHGTLKASSPLCPPPPQCRPHQRTCTVHVGCSCKECTVFKCLSAQLVYWKWWWATETDDIIADVHPSPGSASESSFDHTMSLQVSCSLLLYAWAALLLPRDRLCLWRPALTLKMNI